MKTSIHADGTLVVQAESHLEAFALRKWADEELSGDWLKRNPVGMKFMVRYDPELLDDRDPKGTYISIETGWPL
jgi:hypothetical protein